LLGLNKLNYMPNIVTEIPENHFGINVARKLPVTGNPKVHFGFNSGTNQMTVTLTIKLNMNDGGIVNQGTDAIPIECAHGDLFVSEYNTEMEFDTPDEMHFSYDATNMRIVLAGAIPGASKGNHG
jgi:hypothetical protein